MTTGAPLVHNPAIWEALPNAKLTSTARDVFDILTARQAPGRAPRHQSGGGCSRHRPAQGHRHPGCANQAWGVDHQPSTGGV